MGLQETPVCNASEHASVPPNRTLQQVIDAQSCLSQELEATVQSPRDGVWLCRIRGFQNEIPVLDIPELSYPVMAFAVSCPLSSNDANAVVAVVFDRQSVERPIVLGKIQSGMELLTADVGSLELAADNELLLRCGKASITMKSDGTVAIRGTNVASRASHTNRIRGGNVQIN